MRVQFFCPVNISTTSFFGELSASLPVVMYASKMLPWGRFVASFARCLLPDVKQDVKVLYVTRQESMKAEIKQRQQLFLLSAMMSVRMHAAVLTQ